jgi:tRNA nucleotidyltransferase (CCA-adding enzyme)
MVSFLLSQGASLAVVSSYLNRELKENDLSLLTRLINSTERITIKGLSVSLIELDSADYVGELGVLIHKLMEIENIPALFVLLKTPRGRVDIIARSNLPSLDVNRVMSRFGGGGHPGAAAAKVHGADAESVRRRLIAALKSDIRVTVRAQDIMSRSYKTVDVNDRIGDVRKALLRERLGGMAVVKKGRIAGIITMTAINKAIKGGYSHARVKGYMARDVVIVRPDTPLYAIRKIMSDHESGVIPVIRDKDIVGMINRTDVLRSVHDSLFMPPHKVRMNVVTNLSKKMSAILPKEIVALLRRIGRMSNSEGCSAFIVGGIVRDLILGKKNLDLDIVAEGEAIKLGNSLARELGATIVVHKKFGTCTLYTKDKLKIDIATARREVYEKPAALPTVQFSSLKEDLIRRDFTINAMAVSVNPGSFGQLIDFFGGERDLSRGRIKVLHDGSFIDDPTRIFRAVRFEARFAFAIDHRTGELIKNALDASMFDKVEPQRIRDELVLILKEPEGLRAIRRMAELDELRFIHPRLKLDSDITRLCGAADAAMAWFDSSGPRKRPLERWIIYLMALFDDLSYNTVSSICSRFVFRGSDRIRILSYKRRSSKVLKALAWGEGMAPSRVYRLLEPLAFEVTVLMMAKAASDSGAGSQLAISRIKDFLREYNGTRTAIKGDDIKALGLKPSKRFKLILQKVLYRKIDGKLRTKRDELEYVRKLIKDCKA